MINVVMNKSDNLLLLVDEIYLLEERIDKIGFINNMQIILLWLMLGSILDAFLKYITSLSVHGDLMLLSVMT